MIPCKDLPAAASNSAILPVHSSEQHALFARWQADHAAILHHVANAFATGADRHDLMQELLLSLWRSVPGYRGGAHSSTFVYRVAYNTALMWHRGRANYRKRVDAFEAEAGVTITTDTDRAGRDREMLDLVYARIRSLPPIDRSILLMHLDEIAYAEIAEVLGMSESAVGARLTRIKQRLIENLKETTHELR